ncbi:histidine kinase N-terminal 7TM domain-containing protein [Paenibacillus sp. 7541]|uniref:sensor histidine kinase n=1 Tax=Paenibacillus sp. 7541 TaxID=2026236 RepID=UPI000BA7953A|nr:histidine kinase N-terminal 7TM domain-containing protein [Paenibacillus sp. 7541]PAK54881.1 hypothetical protein CHH75_05915 [Paenibacillus sp. 7541]
MDRLSLDTSVFWILLAATALKLAASYLAYRKRVQAAARYCAWAMLAAACYSFGYAFEIISTSLEQGKLWLKVQHLGIPFITTFWLILAIIFTGHQAFLKRWSVLLLFVIPVMVFIFQFTNDYHHLYYRDVQFDPDSSYMSPILLEKGPLYWLNVAYLYTQGAVGITLFVRMYSRAMPIVRRQVVMMIFGAVAPWLFNIAYIFAYDVVKIDLTPFGFATTGIVFIYGVYRFHLLRLVPVAYQQVFETIQDGVIVLDYDHNLSHVNESARCLFTKLRSWKGEPLAIAELFESHPDLLAMSSSSAYRELRISMDRDGAPHYYQVKISVIYDQGGIFLGKLMVFSDVTQSVLYQEQLLANRNQLEELHAFKDRLFAVVTHDIRDPLALLVSLTEIIEEDFIDPESEESEIFREISSQVRDTHLLVGNLLDWVRSQGGKIHFRPLAWELGPMVHAAVKTIKHRLEAKQIGMTVSVQAGTSVYADKEMVELILRNLMFNAIKYSRTGGHIRIEATRQMDQITLSVKDSGIGVNEEVVQSLFREIQQSSSPGTDGEQGTGIGLYLCEKFVRLNGGEIGYTSSQGEGSTFFFTLPTAGAPKMQYRSWREADGG